MRRVVCRVVRDVVNRRRVVRRYLVRRVGDVVRGWLVVHWRRGGRRGRRDEEGGDGQNGAEQGELVSARGCHWGGSKNSKRCGDRLRGWSNKQA